MSGPEGDVWLYTTLDDALAVKNPIKGPAAVSVTDSFGSAGKCDGFFNSVPGALVAYPAGSFPLAVGTVDFFYRSHVTMPPGEVRHILSVGKQFDIDKDTSDQLRIVLGGTPVFTVGGAQQRLPQDTWVRVTVTWDFSANADPVAVYLNSLAVQSSISPPGPLIVPTLPPGAGLFLGGADVGDSKAADGDFDDFTVLKVRRSPG